MKRLGVGERTTDIMEGVAAELGCRWSVRSGRFWPQAQAHLEEEENP